MTITALYGYDHRCMEHLEHLLREAKTNWQDGSRLTDVLNAALRLGSLRQAIDEDLKTQGRDV